MLAGRHTTTSRRNEMTSGRRSERMMKGRKGGVTRGDATTSLRDEMMIGWCNERMTKQWEGRQQEDETVARREATQHQTVQWDDKMVVHQEDNGREVMWQPASTMRRWEGGVARGQHDDRLLNN